jgi:hypothetical protein
MPDREDKMKIYFDGYGYRETKSWGCPDCKNFSTVGMDLSVDESVERHTRECSAKPTGLAKYIREATERAYLKDLVWLIYSSPEKVTKAIDALEKIAERK